jgi:hypothetical protein
MKERRMEIQGKVKRDSNRIGEISEAAIIVRFLQPGYIVLTPYGGNQRYDLVVEDHEEKLWRIQCKTARIDENNTMIAFNTANRNVTGKNRQTRSYRGQCDYFAAYCEKLNKVYLIRVDQVGTSGAHLWIVPPKRNYENTLWAHDYEL